MSDFASWQTAMYSEYCWSKSTWYVDELDLQVLLPPPGGYVFIGVCLFIC